MLVGDETAKCRLTFWHDDIELINDVAEGDILALNNLVVRENNGRLELHGSKKTEITKNPEGIELTVSEAQMSSVPDDAPYVKIGSLTKDSNSYITLFGVIVQALPPYFYPVDKQTQKRVRIDEPSQFNPEVHDYNYVCNVVLDDGTDTLRIAAFRDEALDILGISKEELLAVQEKPDSFDAIAQKKLGTYCKLIGKPSYNEQYERLEMVAQKVFVDIDPKEELKQFK